MAKSDTQNAAGNTGDFLKFAASKFYAIQGTIPTGSGGATTPVTWQQPVPIIPAYCKAVHLNVQCNVQIVFAAVNDRAFISPFAPYSAFQNQLTLGGAPPWPPMELTPWYLDDIAARIDWDPSYPGLGGLNSGFAATNYFSLISDFGLANWPDTIGSTAQKNTLTVAGPTTDNVNPGLLITNTFAGAATLQLQATFNLTLRLQRKRHLLWGAVPFGDPENRPNHLFNLAPLVGNQPEQCFVVSPPGNSAPLVGTLNGAATVTAIYELEYIDLLPQGMQVPEPVVGYGLQVTPGVTQGLTAGTYATTTHRTAQAYESIHHILVNGGTGANPSYATPIQSDYFALWDDQDPQSARWAYDKSTFTFNHYFTKFLRDKRRVPIKGHYLVDLENGVFPEIPSVDPYDAIMSPDATYAQAFGVPVTPAMTSTLRIPQGVTAVNPYIRTYAFGLVKVPY